MKTKSSFKKFENLEIKTSEQHQLKGGDTEVVPSGIIFLGIGAFFGKVNWGLALTGTDTSTDSDSYNDQA